MKILYVEDEAIISMSMKSDLEDVFHEPGDKVLHAPTYAKAEKLLNEQGPFDLIISDFEFPGIDPSKNTGGIDLCRLVTAWERPVFILSGVSQEKIIAALREAGLAVPEEFKNNIYSKSTPATVIAANYDERYAPKKTETSLKDGATASNNGINPSL